MKREDFEKIALASVFSVIGGLILLYAERARDNEATPTYPGPLTDKLQTDTRQVPPPVSEPAPLNFTVNYIVRPQAEPGRAYNIAPGGTYQSGDAYKIIFTPRQDCYVYLFQQGSSGNIFRLFPLDAWGGETLNLSNPVRAGRTYSVPHPEKSFVLDDTPGMEKFYLLAFHEQQHDLEQIYARMLAAREQGDAANTANYRGQLETTLTKYRDPVDKVLRNDTEKVAWTEEQTRYQVVRQKLELCDACVSKLEFEHRR